LALAVACAVAQTRPKLATTFETYGIIQIQHNNSAVFGEGTPPPPRFVCHVGLERRGRL
jgi:hypothetical protein